jgi:hypothetical protein
VTLEKNSPVLQATAAASSGASTGPGIGTSSATSSSPIAQAFSQRSKDLQAGNLSAALGDFSTIQQDFQNAQSQSQGAEWRRTSPPPFRVVVEPEFTAGAAFLAAGAGAANRQFERRAAGV